MGSESSKSARHLYTKGSNKLLLCKVWLGKALIADKAMTDLTPSKMKKLGYDSLYAKAKKDFLHNDEYVVYNPAQARPVFIIHYQLDELNKSNFQLPKPKGANHFKRTSVLPKREFDTGNPYDVHFQVAASRFYSLQVGGTQRYTIKSIEIVENSALEAKFNAKKKYFEKHKIPNNVTFGFHGTDASNIDSILKSNFDLNKVKNAAHGFGIYFSEQPEVSINTYAKGSGSVLLCKLLLGKSGSNCKEVNADAAGRCWAIVIGETNGQRDDSTMDQILPAYVIHYQ